MPNNLKELVKVTKTLTLLYVEDDEESRNATLKLLYNFFSDIVIATNGLEAIDKLLNNKIDLIISDINMPVLNGLEMLEKIRENKNDTPTIFLSAHNESEYFTQAIKLGAEYFILKPIQQDQFIAAISKIINIINIKLQNIHYKEYLEHEVSAQTKELRYKLHFDNNTKLLNRYSFFEDIQDVKQPLLFLIDINKFKMINEVYGSDIGTKVLVEFGQFLLNFFDESFKVYRLAGNEYAVLSSHNIENQNKYQNYLDNLFNSLNDFCIKSNQDTISVEVTIGISKTTDSTYENAEIALEYAKNNKISYAIYSSEIDKRKESTEILKRKNMIRLAIEQKRILPVYQAIVDSDQKIVKHEILMRIQEENSNKLISPYFFLAVALKTSLYDQLSSIIIFNALEKLKNSNESLSINFAYSDIKNQIFVKEIDTFFSNNPSIGNRAVFEITEDESIKNYDDVKKFIKHFKTYGVRIAIDDFGTGFSNFEHILEIEPNYLKIDGSLIKNIATDSRSFTLVQAIVQFSHKLGIKIIAEFVHNEQVFNMLKDLGVDEYQGYYFSEPSLTTQQKVNVVSI